MLELSSALETEIVVAGLVAMIGMAVWLLFRDESNGEKSLFLKILSPYDGEIERPHWSPCIQPRKDAPL